MSLPTVVLLNRYTTQGLFPFETERMPLSKLLWQNGKTLIENNISYAKQITGEKNIVIQIEDSFGKDFLKKITKKNKSKFFNLPLTHSNFVSLLFILLKYPTKENSQLVVWDSESLWQPSSEFVYTLRKALYQKTEQNILFVRGEVEESFSHKNNKIRQIKTHGQKVFIFNEKQQEFLSSGCMVLSIKNFLKNSKKYFLEIYQTIEEQIGKGKFSLEEFPVIRLEEALLHMHRNNSDFLLSYQVIDFEFFLPHSLAELVSIFKKDKKENRLYENNNVFLHNSYRNLLLNRETRRKKKNHKIFILDSCKNLLVIDNKDYLLIRDLSEKEDISFDETFAKELSKFLNIEKKKF